MCKYCVPNEYGDIESLIHHILIPAEDIDKSLDVFVEVRDGKIRLGKLDGEELVEDLDTIKIHFCPMCGRKLTEP